MPTITNIVGQIPFNAGPITTTFELPASCSDSRYTFYAEDGRDPGQTLLEIPSCTTAVRSECSPHGDKIWEAVSATDANFLPYYSPGGWKTVGTTAYGGNVSGVFTEDLFPYPSDSQGVFLPGGAEYEVLLAPSETLVLCCPS